MEISLFTLILVLICIGILIKFWPKIIQEWKRSSAGAKKAPLPAAKVEEPKPAYSSPPLSRVARQIESISRAEVSPRALLNKGEIDMYWALVRHVDSSSFIVCPQTVMGEFLRTGREAFYTINSKRVDFCIVDRKWNPVCVVEVDGSGHFVGREAGQRNAVKQIALTKAGIKCCAYNGNESISEFLQKEMGEYAVQHKAVSQCN